jgi:GAF domain-containing protein/anti-sigma regulatory factor (Ser/Thr protein kinase)
MNTDPKPTLSEPREEPLPGVSGTKAPGTDAIYDRLRHLQRITEGLAAALTVSAVSEAIITSGVSALGGRAGTIGLLNEDETAFKIVGSTGFPEEIVATWDSISLKNPSAWADARKGETVLIHSPEEMAERYPESAGFHKAFGDKSYAAIPLVEQGRCLGVMGVGFDKPLTFTSDDLEFMRTIARQGALALERARLYTAEREARAEAEAGRHGFKFLADASRVLASSLDYSVTLNAIAKAVVPKLADYCVVDLAPGDGNLERLAVAHVNPERVAWVREVQQKYPPQLDPDRGLGKVLRTGQSEFYPVITKEMIDQGARDEEQRLMLHEIDIRSVMLVPLTARGRTLGIITFVTTGESGKIYTQEDLQLAEDLAQRAGIAVDNTRLFQEAQTALDMHRGAEERLATLTEASSALLTSLKLDQLLPVILDLAERLFDADAYALWRMEPDNGGWHPVCHSGLSRVFTEATIPVSASSSSFLEKPIVIEDIEADSTLSIRYEAHSKEGIRALLVLPLRIREESTGTLTFYYRHPHPFTDSDVRVAGAIANLAAAAISTTELYEEQDRLRAEALAAAVRQKAFIRDVLASVTEGKLFLCNSASDLPKRMKPAGLTITLGKDASLRTLRHRASAVASQIAFPEERLLDLVTAVSEAAMNAVTHAGGGQARVYLDGENTIQVWIEDHGQGIDVAQLPRATLEKGYTTAGSLGHGMKIMLNTIDRLWLLTGSTGTTVVLEQDRVSQVRDWE